MTPVTKRDLNQHTASVLGRVTAEVDVVVTERGTPRWRISAFEAGDAPLARMARDGRYQPPTSSPAPWPTRPGGPAYTDAAVDSLLDEVRGEH